MSDQTRWCILCVHFREYGLNDEFCFCEKTGNRLSIISIGGDDCPLRKENMFNSEW